MAYTSDNMLKSIDWITICIYLALVIFGWFSVCGASYDYGEIDFFSFDTRAGKQLVWISCSLLGDDAAAAAYRPYRRGLSRHLSPVPLLQIPSPE